MNQVGALNASANADLAASGINSLSGGSFGADFALLLGQISQDGSSGIGGALSSNAVRGGRIGFAAQASQNSQRRKDSSKSLAQDLSVSRQDGASAKASQDPSSRKVQSKPRNDAQLRGDDAAQEPGNAGSRGDEAARAGDQAQKSTAAADDAAKAQDAPQALAVKDAAPEAPSYGAAEDDAEALEDLGAGGFMDMAEEADPILDGIRGAGNEARALESGTAQDAAKAAPAAMQGGEGQEATASADGLEALAEEAAPKEPQQARPVSENSATLGELFEHAGVTKVTVSQSNEAAQSKDAQQAADELSCIADSVKAADELFQGQDGQSSQAGEGGQGSESAEQDGVDGALAVLRQGVKGGGNGAQAEGDGAANASGDLEVLQGRVAAGAAGAKGAEGAQDPLASLQHGVQAAAPSGAVIAAASADAGVSPLSQSRLSSRESLDRQDLRETMLELSSDVKRNAEKITEAVMAMSSRNLKSFKFELNPEGLGSMQIKIDSTDDGDAVRIGISASSSQARGILAQGMDALREGLLRNGIFAQAELEGGGEEAMAQDGSAGQGAWQGREGGQGQENGGSLRHGGTLFAGESIALGDDETPAPAKGRSMEDGLSLFA